MASRNIYLQPSSTAKTLLRIKPEERGFTVSIREGDARPFTLELALNDFATIYDSDFNEYYIIDGGNKYILRKSIHSNNNNNNTNGLKDYEESNIKQRPMRAFGRLPPGMEGGRRKSHRRRKSRKSRKSRRTTR